MMLHFALMIEASRRCGHGTDRWHLIRDAGNQGRHHMDAPDTVKDGVEWYVDEDDSEMSAAIPRVINIRNEGQP